MGEFRRVVVEEELLQKQGLPAVPSQDVPQVALHGRQGLCRRHISVRRLPPHGHAVHSRRVGRRPAGKCAAVGHSRQRSVQAVHRVHIQAHLHGQTREDLLALPQQLVHPHIVELVEGPKQRIVPLRQADLLKGIRLQAVALFKLLKGPVGLQKFLVAALSGQRPAVLPVLSISDVLEEIPEILPGDKSAGKIFMDRAGLVEAGCVVQPGLLRSPAAHQLPVAVRVHAAAPEVPGVAHPQEHPEPLLLCRPENAVQLLVGVSLICKGSRGHGGLKFFPRDSQDDAVEAVGGDAGQLLLHMYALAVPEIRHPVVGIVGGGLPVLRLLQGRKGGGDPLGADDCGGAEDSRQAISPGCTPSSDHFPFPGRFPFFPCPSHRAAPPAIFSLRPSSRHTVRSMVA